MKLQCEKQKDDECFPDIHLTTKVIELDEDDEGDPVSSLVLLPLAGGDWSDPLGPPMLSKPVAQALQALSGFPEGEAQSGEWRAKIATLNGKAVSESSFHRYRKTLLDRGLVREVAEHRYKAVVTAPTGVPPNSHGSSPTPASATPTPL